MDPCVSVDPARLAELLALELTVLSDTGSRWPQLRTRVRITCDDPVVILSVDDGSRPAPDEHRLDWATYPPKGRSRLLALALSEMIAGRWRKDIAVPTDVEARPTETVRPSLPAPRPLDLGLLVSVERMGRPQTTAAGLDIDVSWHVRRWLTVRADGRASGASFDTTAGPVSARVLSVLVAGLLGLTGERFWVGAGPGIRGGSVRLRGEPSGVSAVGLARGGGWWGPVIVGGAGYQATRHVVAVLMIDAGLVARPVIGDVDAPSPAPAESVALDRLWITAAAGAAWRF